MTQKKMAQHILLWIEDNIEENKNIDDLVRHMGYSRRMVQLMFKNEFGLPIGTYRRQRKMCRAAILLRLTKLSVIEVANRVHFGTPQNFGRAFKKVFNMTPAAYRNLPSWDLSSLTPAIDVGDCWQIDVNVIDRPGVYIYGESFFYQEKILTSETDASKKRRLGRVRHYFKCFKDNVIIATGFSSSTEMYSARHGLIDVSMLSGVETKGGVKHNDVFYVEGGRYAAFVFYGEWSDYSRFSYHIYMNVLPRLNLHRRNGVDIELFHYTVSFFDDNPLFTCEYFIPVD